jgi:hypothetical protein
MVSVQWVEQSETTVELGLASLDPSNACGLPTGSRFFCTRNLGCRRRFRLNHPGPATVV